MVLELIAALACSGSALAAGPELPVLQARGPLAIRAVTPERATVGRYEKLELTVDLSATYDNPFNPRQVSVWAELTSPSGERHRVFGFFYQPCEPLRPLSDDEMPHLREVGPPEWRVRFAPDEVGEWTYLVRLRDRTGEVTGGSGKVRVTESGQPGFVRVSTRNPRYFEHDDGSPFIPVGQNVQNDWPRYRHSKLLADAGGNALRAWTFCHWTWLEWTHDPDISWAGPGHWMCGYGGAGVYNQRIAWVADNHLAQWERDGLRVMLCLGNGSELGAADSFDSWGGHSYNLANGGWLERGQEFWTDERARKAYRNRLRYIVARYAYSPSVWAWELWNELGRETDEIVAWHREMAGYLHEVDPHGHPVTTSHWGTNAEVNERTWALPEIDFTQTHNYAGAGAIRARTARMLELSPKPHIIGEGGGPSPGPDGAIDPAGIDFHNSLWAGVFSGAAGTTLPWWWRERIEPNDLFHHYTALRSFVDTVDWPGEAWRLMQPAAISIVATGGPRYSPVVAVPLGVGWGEKAPRSEFTVGPDGSIEHLEDLGPVLYGSGRTNWKTPPTLKVAYPAAGRFVVQVSEAAHGILQVELDGEALVRADEFDGPRESFSKDIAIDVSAGAHDIRLENVGSDWLRIGHLLLTDYRDTVAHADAEVFALRSDDAAALWVRHRLNEWAYHALGYEPEALADVRAIVHDMPEGDYELEWWDTYTGAITGRDVASCRDGDLELTLATLQRDTVCIARKR